MLERKIVRLIIMSNISRRQFLKSAGVAALAAGVLAGCGKIPGTDVPDVPEVTSETIDLFFMNTDTSVAMSNTTLSVLKGAKTVKLSDIPTDLFPKGYAPVKNDDLEIRDGGEGRNRRIIVWVKKADVIYADDEESTKTLKKVKVTLAYCSGDKVGKKEDIEFTAIVSNYVRAADFTLPQGVTLADPDYKSKLEVASGYYKAVRECLVY